MKFETAVQFVTRCHVMWNESDGDELLDDKWRTRYRQDGAWRRRNAPELEYVMFDWFTNVRDLYARIRKRFFKRHARYFKMMMQGQGYDCERKIDDNWLVSGAATIAFL